MSARSRPARAIDHPVEPRLAMDEIQGIVVPGFFKPRQTLLYLRIPDDAAALPAFRQFVGDLAGLADAPDPAQPSVSTARQTLTDRQAYRREKKRAAAENRPMRRPDAPVLVAIAFTSRGLARLMPDADAIRSPAFALGMAARSALLGDPVDRNDPGHPDRWLVGGTSDTLDAMLVIADDLPAKIKRAEDACTARLRAMKVDVVPEHGGSDPDRPGREHFGFADGISQPGIRGLASERPRDFITERHIRATSQPTARLQGYPGQDLVWPGEFVLGYEAAGPDPMLPGPVSSAGPDWANNGSFLVYRRLRQDVPAFWRAMTGEARRLSRDKAFGRTLTATQLASLLIGRWPDGTPVMRSAKRPVANLGSDPMGNNDFLYAANTPARPNAVLKQPCVGVYETARADPLGQVCPLASHIRKVNPRDTATDMGGAADTLGRRILRVGVPYGPFVKPADPLEPWRSVPKKDRGLLFMSIQASIENQFEFLQARWMNSRTQQDALGNHDVVAGHDTDGEGGQRSCTLIGKGLVGKDVRTARPFVTPTGGGYFFVPSLSALKKIAKG